MGCQCIYSTQRLKVINYRNNTAQANAYLPYIKPAGLYSLGQACIAGHVSIHEIENLIVSLILSDILPSGICLDTFKILFRQLIKNPQLGSGAYEIADQHYNLGNDLFEAMLDKTMSYTCGYWRDSTTLEQAQIAKLDLICKKLQLQSGMRVLDIGCGWGNFAEHAAKNYGVSVVGLTVSKEQRDLATLRCAGLPVEIILESYEKYTGSFDRIVSIEMIEAVGKKNLKQYFSMINSCLKDNGLAAIQAISADTFNIKSNRAANQYVIWLLQHIFPNGYLPNLDQLMSARSSGLMVQGLENIGDDYVKTLAAWRDNFESAWPRLKAVYDERFYRIWHYYLGGCMAFFQLRMAQVFQVVYRKN